jgi:hypothetical protein
MILATSSTPLGQSLRPEIVAVKGEARGLWRQTCQHQLTTSERCCNRLVDTRRRGAFSQDYAEVTGPTD